MLRSRHHDQAFSLVELLLTLALSVMLMALIGTAFSFYANRLEVRDSEVRRVQLAQSILDMISDDLRAAIYPPLFDDSSLSSLLSSSTGGGGAAPGEGEDLSAAGLDDNSDPSTTDPDATGTSSQAMESTDLSAGTTTTERPGLLGNQSQLQFDVSRLPRIEEYRQMLVGDTPAEITDVPSDIKTITYYIQPVNGGVKDPLQIIDANAPLSLANSSNQVGGGLVRRSLDRAVTQWAMENGGLISLNASGDLLATEVAGLNFRYWDGILWQMYWDSDESGVLPLAIEITLTMLEPQSEAGNGEMLGSPTRVYKHIVRLPMGRPVETDSDSGMSAAGL